MTEQSGAEAPRLRRVAVMNVNFTTSVLVPEGSDWRNRRNHIERALEKYLQQFCIQLEDNDVEWEYFDSPARDTTPDSGSIDETNPANVGADVMWRVMGYFIERAGHVVSEDEISEALGLPPDEVVKALSVATQTNRRSGHTDVVTAERRQVLILLPETTYAVEDEDGGGWSTSRINPSD
jgi:hypothetical protein